MISIRNIRTIARFESKVLSRNWFFRILVIAALFFLTIFNIAAFSPAGDSRQQAIGISWGIPYANLLLLSIGQAAAVIFFATGSILKNKKIDTNEVFFARPISNLDYVMGKAFSLFKLFFWLNVVILCIALIFDLTNPLTSFNPLGYLIYPLLTSMPTIVFATGLAFLVVTLLKNQPISIVLLLGGSTVVLFYFLGKYLGIFDYMAFRFTMMASDMTGFSDVRLTVLQRSFYFVTGIAFLFATAFFLDRLSNHQSKRIATGIVALLLSAVSAYLLLSMWTLREDKLTLRAEMVTVNGQWAAVPNVDILSHHIQLKHIGNQIQSTSTLQVTNTSGLNVDSMYFTLNPGLIVSSIVVDDIEMPFDRNAHIVALTSSQPVKNHQIATVKITYSGTVREEVAHLEVDQKRYELIEESFIYPIQKKYAYLQPDYVLFTKDVLWYPDTQVGYSKESTIKQQANFVDFQLDVKPRDGQLPISQGASKLVEDGYYQFRPEHALPQLSLAIGSYKKRSIVVDSVEFSLYHYPANDYFEQHFDLLEDTLSYLITGLMNGYAHDQKLKYPFKRLQLVEAPILFGAFNKIYESNQSFIQPETVYWPESGGDEHELDFRREHKNMDRQARENNQVYSDKEKQANVFNTFIKKMFTLQIGGGWFFDGRDSDGANYSIFPNLYSFNTSIVSDSWPLLHKGISDYLNNSNPTLNDYSRNINGISFTEECNELMRKSSITEILTQDVAFNKIEKSILLKGEYLFSYFGLLIGEEAFKGFLYHWIETHSHQTADYQTFRAAILTDFGLDIDPIIRQVYSEKDQPSFIVSNNEEYELLDGDRKRYQILFDVENTGVNDGVIKVSFNTENELTGSGVFRRRNPEVEAESTEYLSVIRAGETKQYGFVLDAKPERYKINTLVSRNIPSVISVSIGKFNLRENAIAFEGERMTEPTQLIAPNEVVVDNEDPGFSTFSPIKDTYLKEYLEKRNPSDKKYYGIWRRSYSKWLATTGSNFYGQTIRSAHFTRSGKGDKVTTWTPKLKQEGFYDLYVYLMGKNQNQFDGRGNEGSKYTYQYIINHGDGKDEISFNLANAERGWNYLGSYYFATSGGNLMLTDECDQRSVFADAVKWVKQ